MIDDRFVKKILKGVLRNNKTTVFERQIMHPDREWFLGILVGLLVIVGGIIYSVDTYQQFREVSVGRAEGMDGGDLYKETLVTEAMAELKKREKEYNNKKAELLDLKPEEVISVEKVSTTTEAAVESEGTSVLPAETEESD